MKAILCCLFITSAAHAADGVGAHGGNAVRCNGKPTVTLDYYNASLPTVGGQPDIVDISSWTEAEVVDFFRQRFSGSAFLDLFDRAAEKFGSIQSWPLASLRDVDDGGEPYILPPTCTRVTAAIRQSNTIYVDPDVVQELSPAQKGMLFVHEMLYWISGKDSSAAVRESLRTLLRTNPSALEIGRAIQLIGPYYTYSFLEASVGGLYYPSNERSRKFSRWLFIKNYLDYQSVRPNRKMAFTLFGEGDKERDFPGDNANLNFHPSAFAQCTPTAECSYEAFDGGEGNTDEMCQLVVRQLNKLEITCVRKGKSVVFEFENNINPI